MSGKFEEFPVCLNSGEFRFLWCLSVSIRG
jgi:hypothetical protein